ncbi:NADAR family protein [Sorangium sp. So ce887]
MGRQRSRPLRPDREQVKDDIMREVVLAKFTQHEEFRRAPLDTGDAELVEHTTNDACWADDGDGSGEDRTSRPDYAR